MTRSNPPQFGRKTLRQRLAWGIWLWSIVAQLPLPVMHSHGSTMGASTQLSRHLQHHHQDDRPGTDEVHLHWMMPGECGTQPGAESDHHPISVPLGLGSSQVHDVVILWNLGPADRFGYLLWPSQPQYAILVDPVCHCCPWSDWGGQEFLNTFSAHVPPHIMLCVIKC